MEKYLLGEKFVKRVFQRITDIENFVDDSVIGRGYRPDLSFKWNNQYYIVEVKTKMVPTLLSKMLRHIEDNLIDKNMIAIIVILDRIPDRYRQLVKDKHNIYIFDISNILYMIYDNENMLKELNNIIDFSLDNIIPQKPEIDFVLRKQFIKNQKEDYIESLVKIDSGKQEAKNYERLLEKIIQDIFSNELSLFKLQNRTDDGINIFDMICKIKNNIDDDFFSIVERFFKSKYIVFEFKNYEDTIQQGQICTTEKYLYETALRKVAIIITRRGIDKNGLKLAKGILRESGKLIIVLNDDDIIEMIRLNESGEKASIVLTRKLDDILTTLEK